MDDTKEVEISDTKSLMKNLNSSWKKKIVVIGFCTLVLLVCAVVSMSAYFSLKKANPTTRLVEVNLEEGETLTYQVNQHIEIQGSSIQKASIHAMVGIRVLNKSSEEYWILMKFQVSYVGGNVDSRNVSILKEYFLVRLQTGTRTSKHTNKTTESFDVYGPRNTNGKVLRQVYGILEQLLPAVKRDLYEDVDGEKVAGSNSLVPEDSPLLPGVVKMHREANTSDKDEVLIKNHFDRADFVNFSSEIDLNMTYSDAAFINKSNGMVTKSHAYFSEQLNFGEPIYYKEGSYVNMMKVAVTSEVFLIKQTNFFGQAESENVKLESFSKLVLPKSKPTILVKEKPRNFTADALQNSTKTPPRQENNETNSERISHKRSVRALRCYQFLNSRISRSFKLFEKKVIGIKIQGEAGIWVHFCHEAGTFFNLKIGSYKFSDIIRKKISWNELEERKGKTVQSSLWRKSISIDIPILGIVTLGVEFDLSFNKGFKLSFPSRGGADLTAEVEPYADIRTSLSGYISVWIIRGGVYGQGTLVRLGLPMTVSYQKYRYPNEWCVDLSSRLTALDMTAGIFYQWRCFSFWRGFYWCSRRTLVSFGRWTAIHRNRKLTGSC